MRRVSVIGTSGSGKTTMARALADALECPVLELDSVYHQANWEPLPSDQFRGAVESFIDTHDRWVVDGNYTSQGVAELVWPRADAIVWVDPPKSRVMTQITWRTLSRMALRRRLWNGNTEDWRNLFRRVPEENIVLWAWTTFDTNRARYASHIDADVWQHLTVHRIRTRSDAQRLLVEAGQSS